LAIQHPLVDCGDLVRIGINERRVYSEPRVKEISRSDPAGFSRQPEPGPVTVESPPAVPPHDLQVRLVRPEEEPLTDAARSVPEDHLDGPVPVRLDVLQGDHPVRGHALHEHPPLELFESHDPKSPADGRRNPKAYACESRALWTDRLK
jgi:hypothetical protein